MQKDNPRIVRLSAESTLIDVTNVARHETARHETSTGKRYTHVYLAPNLYNRVLHEYRSADAGSLDPSEPLIPVLAELKVFAERLLPDNALMLLDDSWEFTPEETAEIIAGLTITKETEL